MIRLFSAPTQTGWKASVTLDELKLPFATQATDRGANVVDRYFREPRSTVQRGIAAPARRRAFDEEPRGKQAKAIMDSAGKRLQR